MNYLMVVNRKQYYPRLSPAFKKKQEDIKINRTKLVGLVRLQHKNPILYSFTVLIHNTRVCITQPLSGAQYKAIKSCQRWTRWYKTGQNALRDWLIELKSSILSRKSGRGVCVCVELIMFGKKRINCKWRWHGRRSLKLGSSSCWHSNHAHS